MRLKGGKGHVVSSSTFRVSAGTGSKSDSICIGGTIGVDTDDFPPDLERSRGSFDAHDDTAATDPNSWAKRDTMNSVDLVGFSAKKQRPLSSYLTPRTEEEVEVAFILAQSELSAGSTSPSPSHPLTAPLLPSFTLFYPLTLTHPHSPYLRCQKNVETYQL
jgi:hypothetical protein